MKEYPVDENGVCCLCHGSGTVAYGQTYYEEVGGIIEYPIFCVCIADADYVPVPVKELLEEVDE